MAEVWDGVNLKFTFRKTVDRNLMNIWEEVVQIENSIQFSEEDDARLWQFSSQSLYAVVNNRGVKQVFTHVM
jgi:hypothetical protein